MHYLMANFLKMVNCLAKWFKFIVLHQITFYTQFATIHNELNEVFLNSKTHVLMFNESNCVCFTDFRGKMLWCNILTFVSIIESIVNSLSARIHKKSHERSFTLFFDYVKYHDCYAKLPTTWNLCMLNRFS